MTNSLTHGDQLLHVFYPFSRSISAADETGSAAYFTVNIDDMLNGKPVQHRETQGAESRLFRSYFESITYLTGGCASGFKTVEPTLYKPRLLLVKGTMGKVQVSQIPLQSIAVNHGDVFILGMSQMIRITSTIVYAWSSPS